MATIYYGNGKCTIEGSDIVGVELRYRGTITIEDKSPEGYALAHQNNGIMIFPLSSQEPLSELFDYSGDLRLISAIVANKEAERVTTTIKRVMDYSELLDTKSEDLTMPSEKLNAEHKFGAIPKKTTLKQKYVENLYTADWEMELFYKSGEKYDGYFHIDLKDNTAMTGKVNNEDSVELYFKQGDELMPTKNPSLVPQGNRRRARAKAKARARVGRPNIRRGG